MYIAFKYDIMKRLAIFLFASVGVGVSTNAQEFTYKTLEHVSPLAKVINMSEPTPDYEPTLLLLKSSAPIPAGSVKGQKLMLDAKRKTIQPVSREKGAFKTQAPVPFQIKGFVGNGTQGTPNDNDVAISNSGAIVSVVNSNINIYNDTGKFIISRTLANFARSLGSLNRTFDPRAIYDPIADRFIVVFLQGSTSADTRVITGFSQTNDPNQSWNFYVLPGNVWGDSSWSDYPIISLTNKELFITLNRVKDNTPWQTGFVESLVWQVNKADGYAGDSLHKRLYHDIQYQGKSIWSVCPVKGSNELGGPNQYFVSVRPSDLKNDTVFLHEITNSLDANPQFVTKVLKTNVPYGLQPNALQPSGQYLQTNDARVLSAYKHYGTIHYVGNTIDTALFAPAVYYGRIDVSNAASPSVSGQIISYDTMDIGYPGVAYAGGGFSHDQTSIITFSHVSPTLFPGNCAVFVDRDGNVSAPIVLRKGDGSINVLTDTVERWGDYTGIQPIYNKLGQCLITNSYGIASGQHLTWVARVKSNDPLLGVSDVKANQASQVTVYPVPSSTYTSVEFELTKGMQLLFTLSSIDGKTQIDLLRDKGKAGINRFTFSTRDIPDGVYILNVTNNDQSILSRRIVVTH